MGVKAELIKLDYSKIEDVEVVNIRAYDAPDYVDAFIESASYDGREMSDVELELLNEDSSFIYDHVIAKLY